jgi:hypothetical protein
MCDWHNEKLLWVGLTSYRKPILLPLKIAKSRLNTEKKLFWKGVTDVLQQAGCGRR